MGLPSRTAAVTLVAPRQRDIFNYLDFIFKVLCGDIFLSDYKLDANCLFPPDLV